LGSDSKPIVDRLVAGIAIAGVPKGLIDTYQNELLGVLCDNDDRVVSSALVALRSASQLDAAIENRVVDIAQNGESEVRVNALLVLGHTPINAAVAVQTILPAISDTDDAVKMAAIWSSGTYGKEALVAVSVLRRIADDPDEPWFTRQAALEALRRLE
jgi:hypothetical protein